jgi:hypothetical protein
MVPLLSLWAPILLSAVAVFIASALIHTVLTYHQSDCAPMPSEDAVMEALRKFNIPRGDYLVPRPGGREHMKSAEYQDKVKKGPVFSMTVMSGNFAMGRRFAQWFAYLLVVGVIAGLLAGHLVAPGTSFKRVFHVVGLVAFASYGLALWQTSIWYERSWSTTLKSNIDALIYAVLTGAIFGWLWPHVA